MWDKRAGLSSDGKAMSDVELGWVSGPRAADRIHRQLWDGFNKDGERGVPRVHPTQKPVRLMAWCLGFVPDARVILDPFMGSGTTGVACIRTGRRFVGIEIEPEHFEAACKRMDEAHREPDLFPMAPAANPQERML